MWRTHSHWWDLSWWFKRTAKRRLNVLICLKHLRCNCFYIYNTSQFNGVMLSTCTGQQFKPEFLSWVPMCTWSSDVRHIPLTKGKTLYFTKMYSLFLYTFQKLLLMEDKGSPQLCCLNFPQPEKVLVNLVCWLQKKPLLFFLKKQFLHAAAWQHTTINAGSSVFFLVWLSVYAHWTRNKLAGFIKT